MALTACRECGAALPARSRVCPVCGASLAPAAPVVYRPPPPRPQEKPEQPWWRTPAGWMTAAGWMVLLAGGAIVALFVVFISGEVDQTKKEKDEVQEEMLHLHRVSIWAQDTSATATIPDSATRPVPTSHQARRIWVVSRMLVDHRIWTREVWSRHGLKDSSLPAAWGTGRYYANARSFPELEKHLEGRVAAVSEIEKTSAAWMEERIAALARATGLPAGEIRGIFPPGFADPAPGEARFSDALLQLHRHLVRIDPRARHAGGNEVRYEREEDLRRLQQLERELNAAIDAVNEARQTKLATEAAALARSIR